MHAQEVLSSPRPQEPKVFTSNDTTYMVYAEIPPVEAIIELASKAFAEKRGLQILGEAELPFIRRFSPKEYSRLQADQDAQIDKSGLDWGIAKLKELQQFLGPIDDLLIHRPEKITESWITDKCEKLRSIYEVVGYNSTLSLPSDCSMIEQAEYLKLQALDCLCNLQIDLPSFEYLKGAKIEQVRDQRFAYTEQFSELLGGNLQAVIAYGGSITATDISEIKDFDNLIVATDVKAACRVLRDNPILHLGKEVHGQILSVEALERYLLMTYAPSFRPEHVRIVFGELELPVVGSEILAMMGAQLLASNVFSRRKSLLSKFIGNAEIFQSTVKEDPRSIALIEAHTVVPLATLGWLQQFIESPAAPRLSKRDAAAVTLLNNGLTELHPAVTDCSELLKMPIPELRVVLAETLAKTSAALVDFNLRHFRTVDIKSLASND